ncbi:EAL domain-containing protein [Aromatoleum petrolei]|uniref:EAL domain-containing protein n=1 Tax=Aromatoleum petrolei TaxID=76116 RepID=A0ABX1MLT2_9RHOO|nr:EAL domain-containing protein [Aromatoleum petrolei]NMF87311.1 EAL domain-containing protein [Aromatoleum petrolei]QTQ38556.1 Diguanylate cyclase/phosphodiesterase [Aromatoleum petrolei]
MPTWLIAVVVAAYLGLLFAVAYVGERAADAGRSLIANPYVYALSLCVFLTAWGFYGDVGVAASSGIGYLPANVGPCVMACLWWMVLRKIIRIAKDNRLTSLADFISSRYGKSGLLAGLVTVIALLGVTPYVSLQLKAVAMSFHFLRGYPDVPAATSLVDSMWHDTTFYVTLLLAAFTVVFGTRKLDLAERHEGMVAAIAFDSLVKLLAFLAVGIFVTWGLYDGPGDLFGRAAEVPQIAGLFTIGGGEHGGRSPWGSLFAIYAVTMLAVMFLPRQFQVAVIENVDETHVNRAIWLFPLYFLLFDLFVLPIAFAGLLQFGPDGAVSPETFVLALPMAAQREALALLVFVGGFAAATGMVVVEVIALSTMVCNDLVMPILLRVKALRLAERTDLSGLLLAIRRITIVGGLLLGYAYYRLAGEAYALASIGLLSLAAVAQFAPALLGGLYWKTGTKAGAFAGLGAGFIVWIYTLVVPAFARAGWLSPTLLEQGPFGVGLLRPLALFGLEGLDETSHAVLWSMFANIGAYVAVSLLSEQGSVEQTQAALFVDASRHDRGNERDWGARGSLPDLYALMQRFLGPENARQSLASYAVRHGLDWPREVDADLARYCEAQLSGIIGAASARLVLGSVVEEEFLRDTLTGLPNRALLLTRLGDALDRHRLGKAHGFALLFISLDRFRLIGDSLGATVADEFLIAVARSLGSGLRPGDTAARLGGENFALLLDETSDVTEAIRFAERLQTELAAGFNVDGHALFSSASVGIALGRPDYADPADILRDAETAAHNATRRGGACQEVFAADMRERVVALLDMETQLRRAVSRGDEFRVYYQPIVDLPTGRLAGFEALVRMRRADGTLVPPGEFIPLTEETGLIVSIGRWVLAEACRQMQDWQRRFPERAAGKISVNLAGRQFVQPDLLEQIRAVLAETGLDAGSLKLEVTETLLMEHAESAAAVLTKLRALGIELLMDDFGTGYSSLSYLHRFPLDTLKVDASFVRRMDTDQAADDIVQTIVTLARTLGMSVIAEGVETAAQLTRLRALGVDYGQGYYFGQPLDAEAAEAMIRRAPVW